MPFYDAVCVHAPRGSPSLRADLADDLPLTSPARSPCAFTILVNLDHCLCGPILTVLLPLPCGRSFSTQHPLFTRDDPVTFPVSGVTPTDLLAGGPSHRVEEEDVVSIRRAFVAIAISSRHHCATRAELSIARKPQRNHGLLPVGKTVVNWLYQRLPSCRHVATPDWRAACQQDGPPLSRFRLIVCSQRASWRDKSNALSMVCRLGEC
jgi:hypothetical protein